MLNRILTLILAFLLVGCGGARKQSNCEKFDISQYKEYGITGIELGDNFFIEAVEKRNIPTEDLEGMCLDDVRFYNWEESDWWNNNHIRAVRIYLDAFRLGLLSEDYVKEHNLDQYNKHKKLFGGKFNVAALEPFMAGGLMVYGVFIDNPEYMVVAWVYSCVDDDTITGYDVRSFEVREREKAYTKEEIEGIMKQFSEDPYFKLW